MILREREKRGGGGKEGDREGMKGGKKGRRQGKEEKSYYYRGMEEDRTIMRHAYTCVRVYMYTVHIVHNHKSLTWSHLSMHFWWKS